MNAIEHKTDAAINFSEKCFDSKVVTIMTMDAATTAARI